MRKLLLGCVTALLATSVNAQLERAYLTDHQLPHWVQLMYASNPDPGQVIAEHDAYYQTHTFEKNAHTQYYKRWLRSFGRNVAWNPTDKASKSYVERSIALRNEKGPTSDWQCIGPRDFDFDAASRSYAPGAAHVYTVERSVSNPNVMYAGTATAGLWKSTDGGQNWSLMTQDLLINRVFAIEIDYTNENIVYFESGGDVYKTTDGGVNWSIIGDAAFQTNSHSVQDIVMSPVNNQEIYLTSDYGFYRTTDAGANWTQVMSGEFQEIELNPADPTMVYTIKQINNQTEFYRSANSGVSFTIQTTGWPSPGTLDHQERVEIAVSPADPTVIYANATGSANGGSGTYGIYKSSDYGSSWTFQCCGSQPAGPPSLSNQNLMGWDKEGEDDGGQYYYDVALAVDPNDINKLHLGGVNHWVSSDGGVTWICPAKWSEPAEPGYVHADIHDIRYLNGELWIACDGGLFKSTDGGTNFSRSMYGIEGSDFWGFGASPQSDVMLGGAYHNGTLLKDNSTYINDWICTGGGDGVRGFVNFGNDRIAYDDYEGRKLSGDRTLNIQGFQFDSLPNASYIIGNSSNMEWDPRNINHIYLGRGKNLIKTTDNGLNEYQIIATFADKVMRVEQARTNLDVFYVTTYQDWWGDKKIWRSTDGGQSWIDITPSNALLVNEVWVPYDITVSGTDENTLWAARTSQYSSYPDLNGKSVYKSTDGGTTWTNYTTSTLDGEWITNIVHQEGTDGGVYVGTRRAVYYRNNAMSDWALFNNNLPLTTTSTKLVIKYKDKKLRNASNRSVYEVELYETSEPIAQIAADRFEVNCMNEYVQYIDHSVLSSDNATWSWSFPGGTPSTSTAQNPMVQYAAPGTYDVTLIVTDDYGTSTQSYTAFIEYVQNTESLDLVEDFELGISDTWTQYNANGSYAWSEDFVDNGPYCTATNCLKIDHFNINAVGDEAELITPYIDLTDAVDAELHFDYAYAKYGGTYEDGFRIDISTDCWSTFDTLWYAFGDSLSTVPNVNTSWVPADCADWSVNNIVDLQNYLGQQVMIRFVGINGWGNNFYMDNVNVSGHLIGVEEHALEEITVYPNPSHGTFIVEHSIPNVAYELLTIDGKRVQSGKLGIVKTTVNAHVAAGTYILHLTHEGQEVVRRIVIE